VLTLSPGVRVFYFTFNRWPFLLSYLSPFITLQKDALMRNSAFKKYKTEITPQSQNWVQNITQSCWNLKSILIWLFNVMARLWSRNRKRGKKPWEMLAFIRKECAFDVNNLRVLIKTGIQDIPLRIIFLTKVTPASRQMHIRMNVSMRLQE
jgi:hypothetical protein